MRDSAIHLELVVCTRGRSTELERLLDSFDRQTYGGFELTVVDQNDDHRVETLLASRAPRYPVRRLRSPRGLSAGRNAALAQPVASDVVGFPDDDCWYGDDVVALVARFFAEHREYDGLAGRAVDAAGRDSSARWHSRAGAITRANVWNRAISPTIFLRRTLLERVGPFDESLGPGSTTARTSGDETDYLLRALRGGARVFYDPSLTIFHEERPVEGPEAERRSWGYGLATGWLLRAHRYPWWFCAYFLARPVGGAVLDLARRRRGHARRRLLLAKGRLVGMCRGAPRPE